MPEMGILSLLNGEVGNKRPNTGDKGIQWMPMLDTVLLGLGHFQGNPDGFSKKKTWDVYK